VCARLGLLRQVTLNGTPEEIIDQAAEWRDHGVSHAMLLNLSALQPSVRKSLATTLPTLKVLRGLKKL
jgi:phthiodiolone/phenolphthiodiolone dimycocerosates ketoreductase